MGITELEGKRNFCYFLIFAILILNVLDAGFAGYFFLLHSKYVERNPLLYLAISNLGLVNFLLLKCVGVSSLLLFAWFVIEKIQSSKILSLAVISFVALYFYYGFVVVFRFIP